MNRFEQLLQQVTLENELRVGKDSGGLLVTFRNGRRQRIEVMRQQERYVLTSVVLTAKQVESLGRTRILTRLWQRNRYINVVAFGLDKRGRLVGRIEQLTETMDSEELEFYIELLARECDQFEYVLTGQDVQ